MLRYETVTLSDVRQQVLLGNDLRTLLRLDQLISHCIRLALLIVQMLLLQLRLRMLDLLVHLR